MNIITNQHLGRSNTMNKNINYFILLLILLMVGCQKKGDVTQGENFKRKHVVVHILNGEMSIECDGALNEPIWKMAHFHDMKIPSDQNGNINEGGKVYFLVDDHYLYLGLSMVDTDIVQESDKDQDMHYASGDLIELFIKPANKKFYWEIYITPNEKKSIFHFLSSGRGFLPSSYMGDPSGIQVKAVVDGTLNDPSDIDKGWTGEMIIPLELLEKEGVELEADNPWEILIGRYNYSVHLPKVELSTFPLISKESFHMHNEWSKVIFQKK